MASLSTKTSVTTKRNTIKKEDSKRFLDTIRSRAADLYSWAAQWQAEVGNVPLVSPDVQKKRLEKCQGGCVHYISDQQRCGSCNCKVAIKTITLYDPHTLFLDKKHWKRTACPENKWGDFEEKNDES